MSDDAQTIQASIQLLELGGRLTLSLGGLLKNYGIPVLKGGIKGLGKILQVTGVLINAVFKEKNGLTELVEKKGNDIAFFEIGTENNKTLEDFMKQMKAYGITYAKMPELCGGDGKTQFAFSPKDAVRFKMFLRNHAERKKDHPDLPDINIISMEDYANTGYDTTDKPTPELSALLKSAEQEIKKEEEAKEKEAQKIGKKVEHPEKSPGPQTKTCRSLEEALNRFDTSALKDPVAKESYIVDRENPENIICCRSVMDKRGDKESLKTEYEVYRKGETVYKAEGRNANGKKDWPDVKRKIRIESGIKGKCYLFMDKKDFEKWTNSTSKREDTVGLDEFYIDYEKQNSPGFEKTIDADNLIKVTKDGHILVDVPELQGSCILIDRDSIISKDKKSIRVRFSENRGYLLMEKISNKSAYITTDQLKSFWRIGSLHKRVQEANNQMVNNRNKIAAKSTSEFAKDMSGNMDKVLHSVTNKRSIG